MMAEAEKKPVPTVDLEPPRRVSLTATVADQLAELIIAESFGAGEKLPSERELSDRLQVSRIVVREALRALAERGLVHVKPGVGTFVVAMTESAVTGPLSLYIKRNRVGVHHLFELRMALEPAISFAAATFASAADLDALAENLRATEDITGRLNYEPTAVEQFAWADLEFHQLLARASGNPLYQVVLEPLIDSQLEVRRKGAQLPGAARLALEGHSSVFEAVMRNDAHRAEVAMREHLDVVGSWFVSMEAGSEEEANGGRRRRKDRHTA